MITIRYLVPGKDDIVDEIQTTVADDWWCDDTGWVYLEQKLPTGGKRVLIVSAINVIDMVEEFSASEIRKEQKLSKQASQETLEVEQKRREYIGYG